MTERTEQKEAGMTAEQMATHMKLQRDYLLRLTDKYMLPDFPVTDGNLKAIKEYRHALRDLPGTDGFPDVDFPEMPECMTRSTASDGAETTEQ